MLGRLLDPSGLAMGRAAVGVSMLTRPGLVPAILGVDRGSRDRMAWAMQMLGAREVALGVGSLVSRKEPRLWLAAGLLSDSVDALAVASALGTGRVRALPGAAFIGIAAVAAAIGAQSLRR